VLVERTPRNQRGGAKKSTGGSAPFFFSFGRLSRKKDKKMRQVCMAKFASFTALIGQHTRTENAYKHIPERRKKK
jgi:hypothetical protein